MILKVRTAMKNNKKITCDGLFSYYMFNSQNGVVEEVPPNKISEKSLNTIKDTWDNVIIVNVK